MMSNSLTHISILNQDMLGPSNTPLQDEGNNLMVKSAPNNDSSAQLYQNIILNQHPSAQRLDTSDNHNVAF